MVWYALLGLLQRSRALNPLLDHSKRDYYLYEHQEGATLNDFLANNTDLIYETPSKMDNYHIISTAKGSKVDPHDNLHSLKLKKLHHRAPIPKQDSSLEAVSAVIEKYNINDPLFPAQWHIVNTNSPGDDVNVVPVWDMGITGKGVVTAIIDDGLDYTLSDLKNNYSPEGSWDFNDNRPEPHPELTSDYHGTRCAGEIAAGKSDGVCGVGVAFDSKVAGIRILSAQITAEDEALAMIYGLDVNDIYSCSWGPADNGKAMEAPDKVVRDAMVKGIQDGRKGKGALYVFASGNGAARGDNCNYDGYTNSIYSITVAAIDHKGLHPPYSESCTAVMVSTYSSGSGEHIHTTDLNEKCSDTHGGTSAAAPLAAGIYALVLEANPELTWRDVQALTVHSAVEIDSTDPSWQNTEIPGRRYSPKYGWGKIDAEKMVNAAKDWTLIKPQGWMYMPYKIVATKLKEVGEITDSFIVDEKMTSKANLESIEQITVTINLEAKIRGDVEVDLVSPNGHISPLAMVRNNDKSSSGFRNWTFSTVAHWGESGVGEWKIKIRNHDKDNSLSFGGWQMKMFGQVIDSSKAKRFDVNEDYSKIHQEEENESDSDSDDEGEDIITTTVAVVTEEPAPATTTEEAIATTTTADIVPLTPVGEATATTAEEEQPVNTDVTTKMTTVTDIPVPTSDSGKSNEPQTSSSSSEHYLIYLVLILIFGFGSLMYLITHGRRTQGRARRREEFEFDIIHPSDDEFDFDDDFDQDLGELDLGSGERDGLVPKRGGNDMNLDKNLPPAPPSYDHDLSAPSTTADSDNNNHDVNDQAKDVPNEESK